MSKRAGRDAGDWQEKAARLLRRRGSGRAYLALVRERAAAGDIEAIWWLAEAYSDGFSDADGTRLLPRSRSKAIELYRRGVAAGHTSCMVNLASLLWHPPRTVDRTREALRLEHRAARLGEVAAMSNLGTSYKQLGRWRTAVKWFRRALAAGDDGALLEIAKAQLFARGTRRNIPEAMASLERVTRCAWLSECEREEARLLLAYLQIDGWLVKRSPVDAMRGLRAADRRGSDVARALLACW